MPFIDTPGNSLTVHLMVQNYVLNLRIFLDYCFRLQADNIRQCMAQLGNENLIYVPPAGLVYRTINTSH